MLLITKNKINIQINKIKKKKKIENNNNKNTDDNWDRRKTICIYLHDTANKAAKMQYLIEDKC